MVVSRRTKPQMNLPVRDRETETRKDHNATTSIRRDLDALKWPEGPSRLGLDSVLVPEPYFTFGEVRLRRRRSPGNLRIVRSDAGLTHSCDLTSSHGFRQLLQPCGSPPKKFAYRRGRPMPLRPESEAFRRFLPVSHGPPRRQADGADDATAAEFHPLAQDHFGCC